MFRPPQLGTRLLMRPAGGLLLWFALAGLTVAARAQHGGGPGPGGPGGPGMGAGPRPGMMEGPSNEHRAPGNFGEQALRSGPRLGPPGRWWDDKHTIKTLNLRTDQQRRMDDIFEASKGSLMSLYANFQREEDRLGSMSHEDLQDEAKVFAAIDRVAQARADLAKANAHISLQIRRELDASQQAALDREAAAR